MSEKRIKINRAPVMTLWATVVAERIGYDHDTALTLGKSVAGLNAQSKGRRLGIFDDSKGPSDRDTSREPPPDEQVVVPLLGRSVPAVHTVDGLRATNKGDPVEPQSVQRYLTQKFGEDLRDVQAAMQALAESYPPRELAGRAYALYEGFRPSVPEGEKGWGAKGELDLERIRSLAKSGA